MVEPRVVIPAVVGSIPIVHPNPRKGTVFGSRVVFEGPLAQLVEQLTLNQLVVGSIPTRPTIPARGAKVAELVNALDLGSSGVTLESSSLSFRTIFSST